MLSMHENIAKIKLGWFNGHENHYGIDKSLSIIINDPLR